MSMRVIFITFIVLFVVTLNAKATGRGGRVEGKLNVHLVSHTHDDVGWLKTVDQYFYGANNSIQNAGVQYILDTVVPCLVDNPNRKFIYVEQAFFQRWWREQSETMQATVKKLVSTGQLEFINGGWCMHDEAAAHYIAMIDQTTLGHRFLLNEFGAVPTIGWQIDPFGHSATQASLLSARVGFDGLFFARIDYQDSNQRNSDKSYEMIWRPSPSLGAAGQVFTGAFERNGYGAPRGFDWDIFSGDAPIQDDPNLEDFNVQSRVDDFVNAVMDQFSANKGDDIMLTLGSDFEYSDAYSWFVNIDKLIDYVNADGRVNAFYSTPSIYVKAKNSANISWPVKTDDFFPYADCPHCYWTGYFTSRPALKRNVRVNSALLNAGRKVEFLAGLDGSASSILEQAVGVAQHHDAVSGTSKQHVAYDYARRLGHGANVVNAMIDKSVSGFLGNSPSFTHCTQLNETYCQFTQSATSFVVVLFNPTGTARSELVKLPVSGTDYVVHDFTGKFVNSQTEQSFVPYPKLVTPAANVLYFKATTPSLGYSTYFVEQQQSEPRDKKARDPTAGISIENSVLKITFTSSGAISSVTNKLTGVFTPVSQQFMYYTSLQNSDQNSGAYIFRPSGLTPVPACTLTPTVSVVSGVVVSEVRTQCDWLSLTVRLAADENFFEMEFQTGEVPISDGIGKEVISRISTGIKTNAMLYTDSNGREFQARRRNYRPTWNLTVTEPVAGNYYPINAAAFIKDANTQLTVLNDRSQGCASLIDGQLEIMFHRRLLQDDSRGVGEPLNETDAINPYPNPSRIGTGLHITGSHYVYIGTPNTSLVVVRDLQTRVFSPLVLSFSPLSTSVQQYIASHKVFQSFMVSELPDNLELMTLQALGNGKTLFRLAHKFAVGEDRKLSVPVTIDVTTLFVNVTITSIQEVSLTANRDVNKMEPMKWNTFNDSGENSGEYEIIPFDGKVVTINPMDVRTFIFSS